MKIKRMIATLLAGVLMAGNLSAVCLAADDAPEPVNETVSETAEAVPTSTEVSTEGGAADDAAGSGLPEGFTIGAEIQLPPGVSFDENGNFVFDLEEWEAYFGDMEETPAADETEGEDGSAEDNEEEPVEIVTVGTVNVRSDTYLHLRTGPGMENQIIGHLLRGTEVEVVGESGDWYQVVIPEAAGYVHKDYLTVEKQTKPVVPPVDDKGQDTSDGDGDSTGEPDKSNPGSVSEMDKDTLMMFLMLMMSMGNMDPGTAEPPADANEALTPDGNLTLVDDYSRDNADGSGKQFITLVTKAGNTFYLIIDRDDEGEQTVHFLNLVDERDLLSLMDEEEAKKYTQPEQETPPPSETEKPDDGDGEDKPAEPAPAKKANPVPVLILVLALLGGGGFFASTKFFKGKKKEQARPDPDADYSEDDEDYGLPDDLEDEEDGSGFDGEDDEPV